MVLSLDQLLPTSPVLCLMARAARHIDGRERAAVEARGRGDGELFESIVLPLASCLTARAT